jgi:hypothetical protein
MGPVWRPLPDELPLPARLLVEQLRELKDAHGLSLADIATATHYSRASWERWLNGKRLVTRSALLGFISVVGADEALLLELLSQAAKSPRPAAPTRPPTPPPAAPPSPLAVPATAVPATAVPATAVPATAVPAPSAAPSAPDVPSTPDVPAPADVSSAPDVPARTAVPPRTDVRAPLDVCAPLDGPAATPAGVPAFAAPAAALPLSPTDPARLSDAPAPAPAPVPTPALSPARSPIPHPAPTTTPPASAPERAPRRRRLPKRWSVALAGLTAVLAAAILLLALAGPGAGAGSQLSQARSLATLLSGAADNRAVAVAAVVDIEQCQNLQQAAVDLDQMGRLHAGLVQQLSRVRTDRLAQHQALVSTLDQGWQASQRADDDYARWAQDSVSSCADGHRPAATAWKLQGDEASAAATADKQSASVLWNAIATQDGLARITADQL